MSCGFFYFCSHTNDHRIKWHMTDSAKLSRLTAITKAREEWLSNIEYVGSLLDGQSTKVTAKALWMLGEMGLRYPEKVASYVGTIASFLESDEDLLRERSLNALGRIGRADFQLIAPSLTICSY